jgi:Domain of unknown function (DUF4174)
MRIYRDKCFHFDLVTSKKKATAIVTMKIIEERSFMKLIVTTLCISSAVANPLDAYNDVKRVIVVSSSQDKTSADVTAILKKYRASITDRDLVIIDVSESAFRVEQAETLTKEKTQELREKLKLTSNDKKSVFVLIGKDGSEKAREYDTLPMQQWCEFIDQMPMRRSEIEDKKKKAR